jgi:protocatechuate 3,4-dioxygenase beta subunit
MGPDAGARFGARLRLALTVAAAIMLGAAAPAAVADTPAGTGSISGRVTDAQDNGLREVVATAAGGAGVSGAGGLYTIGGLAPGDYWVQFGEFQGGGPTTGLRNLVPQFYGRGEVAVQVHVDADTTTTGIDAQMQQGGAIDGRVTDATGDPIAGVDVTVPGANASTDAAGRYALTNVEPGTYAVYLLPPADYLRQNYGGPPAARSLANGQPSLAAGYTPVTVVAGATTDGIDAQLQAGGAVAGTVTDERGRPLSGISVRLESPESQSVLTDVFAPAPFLTAPGGTALTDATGRYRLDGLGAGSYRVSFAGADFVAEYYGGAQAYDAATPIAVGFGATTDGIDVRLQHAGRIAGTVTDQQGRPTDAIATAYRPDGTAAGGSVTYDGGYAIANLAPGSYYVFFGGRAVPWESVYSPTPGGSPALVRVLSGDTTTGIDGRQPAAPIAAPATPAGPQLERFGGTLAVSRGGVVAVSLRCAGTATCAGTASLSVAAGASRRTIGRRGFSVRAGAVAAVRLRLVARGRALLARRGGRVTARLTLTDRRITRTVSARLRAA